MEARDDESGERTTAEGPRVATERPASEGATSPLGGVPSPESSSATAPASEARPALPCRRRRRRRNPTWRRPGP